MTDLERMQIERQCGRLITGYCNHVDARNYDAFLALFASDAEWETQAGGPMRGHEAFRADLDNRSSTSLVRHVSTNARVEVIDETHATGRSYVTLYRDNDHEGIGTSARIAPALVAEHHDTYVREDGTWRIGSRVTKAVFAAAP